MQGKPTILHYMYEGTSTAYFSRMEILGHKKFKELEHEREVVWGIPPRGTYENIQDEPLLALDALLSDHKPYDHSPFGCVANYLTITEVEFAGIKQMLDFMK